MNNLYVLKLPLQAKPEAISGLASTVEVGLEPIMIQSVYHHNFIAKSIINGK